VNRVLEVSMIAIDLILVCWGRRRVDFYPVSMLFSGKATSLFVYFTSILASVSI